MPSSLLQLTLKIFIISCELFTDAVCRNDVLRNSIPPIATIRLEKGFVPSYLVFTACIITEYCFLSASLSGDQLSPLSCGFITAPA